MIIKNTIFLIIFKPHSLFNHYFFFEVFDPEPLDPLLLLPDEGELFGVLFPLLPMLGRDTAGDDDLPFVFEFDGLQLELFPDLFELDRGVYLLGVSLLPLFGTTDCFIEGCGCVVVVLVRGAIITR